ncbi:MAG: xanthine dehydrogenase family protein molybdopterin-binding subunit [Rhodospirillaceae bacterium]|jgi:carbon-monoxide dehydrogenase large subunit|nr:xanthine dehydrogenase family protein molybdopterin-binding subunit [Rhodospirillaceae bacterium]MBT3932142.1 xanthine dehydrogenase family protein molybdopterin-binding subunit [Rhodospirillaceae bacterium]MBT4773518.1 xanthine dehydrogenase family protein molybdopterin-binding subunit [Rhodospirillaceae bacterium]MBT5358040.1 xanthine dehydrogenase family protein molybdopterin-binding subunit [Rhodospirillaceae bacterium]MBT5769281.1 xanthine dehydrogenase family protein molybdopterin-bind
MREYGIGQSVPRVEDRRLLTGKGNYTDDRKVPGAAYMAILRSPHAAATIRTIDTSAAAAMPGVIEILTADDLKADSIGGLACGVKRKQRDGSPMVEPPYPLLADGDVHLVGMAVAAVVAETYAEAVDATEAIEVDYDPRTPLIETGLARSEGAPEVWDSVPGNESFVFALGDKDATDAAFAAAAHVVELDYEISRVSTNTMEVRAAIGFFDPLEERYTLYAGVQSPHRLRSDLARNVFAIPEGKLRVISPDMGGGFGMRGSPFVEHALVLWAARRTGRPVRFTATRSEALASDYHARDNVSRAALALDADGKFLGLKVSTDAALGGYLSNSGPHSPTNNLGGLSGVYTTPHVHVEARGVFTHTSPTATYRGAGRPEASYGLERLIDASAYDLGIDPVELRRRNLIPNDALPYDTGFIFTYDSGDFTGCLERVVKAADRDGFEARRAEAAARGKLRGMGIATVIEIAGGPLPLPNEESAAVRFDTDGGVSVLMGTHSHGQGHETAFAQIASEVLGVPFDSIRVQYGDTDLVHHGKGTFGSRSISVGGAALLRASEKIIARATLIAAHLLEAAAADIQFDDGVFTVSGTDRTITLTDVATASYQPAKMPREMDMGLSESAIIVPPGPTYPNGAHACEVEIDPDTGVVEIIAYTVFDDVGVALNPMMVEGQVHGGVVQGAGQALLERVVYDPDSGQLLTGSFMDYAMPRADDFPSFDVHEHNIPSKNNPMGLKGAGEAGTVGALPSVMNAVCDALRPLGIRHIDMPASPERVWLAIQNAKQNAV